MKKNNPTARQTEVLNLYMSGLTQKEIGVKLGCDQSNVSRLLIAVQKKLPNIRLRIYQRNKKRI